MCDSILEKADAPGMPTITEITSDSATIHWTAPKSDGGSAITSYKIEKRKLGTYYWETVNLNEKILDTTYTIRGLIEETDYEFRVLAENKAGVSTPSVASQSAKYGELLDKSFFVINSKYFLYFFNSFLIILMQLLS